MTQTQTTMNSRHAMILTSLKAPKTLYELADEFHVTYHTIRREVMRLKDMGFVSEYPFREGKAIKYQTIWSESGGKIRLQFQFGQLAVSWQTLIERWGQEITSANLAARRFATAMAHLSENAWARSQNSPEGYPDSLRTREEMLKAREGFAGMLALMDQVLAAPVDDTNLLEITGVQVTDEIRKLSHEFFEYARDSS